MAWCPECKEEYEDHIKVCGDCDVELVESLDDINRERMLIVVNTKEEADKAIEFLEYSQLNDATIQEKENEHGEKIFVIYIDESLWEKAARIMQGFVMAEKEEPNLEDYYFDEYETLNIEGDAELSEIKSSYMAFIGLGGIIAIAGVANLLNLASFLNGNVPLIFTVIGIVFVLIGIYTKVTMKTKVDGYQSVKEEFDAIYEWYLSNYPIDTFFNRHEINLEGMDDGAKYFALMDFIVKECEKNSITDNDKMINTVAEKVYYQL